MEDTPLQILESLPDWFASATLPGNLIPDWLAQYLGGDFAEWALTVADTPAVRASLVSQFTDLLAKHEQARSTWQQLVNYLTSDGNNLTDEQSAQYLAEANEVIALIDRVDAQLVRFGLRSDANLAGLGAVPVIAVVGIVFLALLIYLLTDTVLNYSNKILDTWRRTSADSQAQQRITQANIEIARRTGQPVRVTPGMVLGPSPTLAPSANTNSAGAILKDAVSSLTTIAAIGVGGLLLIKALPALTGGNARG